MPGNAEYRNGAMIVRIVGVVPLPAGGATEATLAQIKAKTDNLDVLLSTRTKPADAQKVDGSAVVQPVSAAALPLPAGASTDATVATVNASVVQLDADHNARLGAVADVPGALTLLDRLKKLQATVATDATLQRVLAALLPKAAPPRYTTLLHR